MATFELQLHLLLTSPIPFRFCCWCHCHRQAVLPQELTLGWRGCAQFRSWWFLGFLVLLALTCSSWIWGPSLCPKCYDQFSLCRWVSKLKFLLTCLLIDFSCRYLSLLLSSQQFTTFVSACLSLEYGGAGEKEGKAAPRELCLSDKGGQRQPKARLCLVCDSPGTLLLAAASSGKALGWFWNVSHW